MKKCISVCLGLMLVACMTVPTVESIVTDGGEVIPGGIGSMIGADGVTLTAVDGTWTTYLAPDGRKEVFIKPRNDRQTLSWRFKDDGAFCEEMYETRSEKCNDDGVVLVKRANEVFSIFTDGKMGKYPFKITGGNTNNY